MIVKAKDHAWSLCGSESGNFASTKWVSARQSLYGRTPFEFDNVLTFSWAWKVVGICK